MLSASRSLNDVAWTFVPWTSDRQLPSPKNEQLHERSIRKKRPKFNVCNSGYFNEYLYRLVLWDL